MNSQDMNQNIIKRRFIDLDAKDPNNHFFNNLDEEINEETMDQNMEFQKYIKNGY